MVCKHCGSQNDSQNTYCTFCGRRLKQKTRKIPVILAFSLACLLIGCSGIAFLLLRGHPAETETDIGIDTSTAAQAQPDTQILQVLPMEDGVVAVLYADGIVRVSGNTQLSDAVLDWRNVDKLYADSIYKWKNNSSKNELVLFGITQDGSVLSTAGDYSGWSDVKELFITYEGPIGITYNGRVLTEGNWHDTATQNALESMCDVEALVHSNIQEAFACLKKDGTVQIIYKYGFGYPAEVHWSNVKEVRDSGHSFYVIKNDGTVDGGLEPPYPGLRNVKKVVSFYDWLFGISVDGKLLTQDGGNIYAYGGLIRSGEPGLTEFGMEIDISRFDQVDDILVCWGMILLNRDGTAVAIGDSPAWDVSDWKFVKKICYAQDFELKMNRLYSLQQNGSVIVNQYSWEQDVQTVFHEYLGWEVVDIFQGENGIVGLTADGTLVGDGAYENTDFTVFER